MFVGKIDNALIKNCVVICIINKWMEEEYMDGITNYINTYLEYCRYQKNLSDKTLKAYRIDLNQFNDFCLKAKLNLDKDSINKYIMSLYSIYKVKTIKRKIASLKALSTYLVFEEIILNNPFNKIKAVFKEPKLLPKTIPIDNISLILNKVYKELEIAKGYYYKSILRDISVLELLVGTGLRVSELCNILINEINLESGYVKIFGKGSKERVLNISNKEVLGLLKQYKKAFHNGKNSDYFFLNKRGERLSEQSVRFMIKKYANQIKIDLHITPHMFRHTFATMLLEEDVDIRYIQSILGHSSITTTQIYTHVTSNKQKEILTLKNPRNKIQISR